MYEQQKLLFEANLRRCELTPTVGDWFVVVQDTWMHDKSGRCCALSPSLLGLPAEGGYPWYTLSGHYGVSVPWVQGVLNGFDGVIPGLVVPAVAIEYEDGRAWGTAMRRYLPGMATEGGQPNDP